MKKIIYGIFLIVSVILYVVTDADFSGVLFLFLLVYLILGLLLARLTGRKVQLHYQGPDSGNKGQQEEVQLVIQNESWAPVFLCTVSMSVENILTGKRQQMICRTALAPKGKRTFSYLIGDDCCGCIRMQTEEINISEPLGIFQKARPASSEHTYHVLPALGEMHFEEKELEEFDMESNRYSSSRKGNDPGETFGLHEYVPGDSMKFIHWKLSGKMDEIVVREPGLPVENNLMVILDNCFVDGEMPDEENISKTTECFFSVSYSLAKRGMTHTIGWYQHEKGYFISKKIKTTEDVFRVMPAVLASPYRKDEIPAADHFIAEETEQMYTGFFYVTPEGMDVTDEVERLKNYGTVTVYRP